MLCLGVYLCFSAFHHVCIHSRVSAQPQEGGRSDSSTQDKRRRGGSKDSDDDSASDEEDRTRHQSKDKDKARKSAKNVSMARKSATKVKKEKTFGPPPLQDTRADRFDTDGQNMRGLCISVELTHVLEGNEKISCSVSCANLSEGAEWREVSHTEKYKLEEEKLSSSNAKHANRVAHQFQLLQDPAFLSESTHILVILYKTSKNMSKGKSNSKGDGSVPVCSGVIRCDELLQTGGITQVKMALLAGGDLSAPKVSKQESSYNTSLVMETPHSSSSSSDSSSDQQTSSSSSDCTPTANLGVVVLSSALMYQRRMKLTSDMKCSPYAENMFCFRTVSGEAMVLEQLFASRYSLTVAKAMLGLIIPERKTILSETKNLVKSDLKKAISALKNIPSKAALQELDDMLTGGGDLEGKNTIETVSRAEALQRTKNVVKEISEVMLEGYRDCEDHCTQALEGETFPGMVISPDVGGSQLRRSVWKKSPVWQFCTTNLNVNVMTWRKFSDNDLKLQAHLDTTVPHAAAVSGSATGGAAAKLCTAATVTFGAPAAHGLGFSDGGIRRLMGGLGSHEGTRVKWMCLLQATGGVSMELLQRSSSEAREFRKLFDIHVDMATGDGWTAVFQKASKLAMRIDACASQALGFAVAAIKSVLTLASYGELHQTASLANAFAMGNFLLPVESFLSTQGHEMGMIEDLEAAVLWLSSVKIRLVSSVYKPSRAQKFNSQHTNKRHPIRTSTAPGGMEVYIGLCDDICIRRDHSTGTLVCDLEMSPDEIQVIKRVLAMNQSNPSHTHTPPVPPTATGAAAAGVSLNQDSSGTISGQSEGVIINEESGSNKDSDKVIKESIEVLAEFGLTGVVFTCGVNEMQSLVNLSGGKEAYKQNEINYESFERLSKYLMQYNSYLGTKSIPTPPTKQKNKIEQSKDSMSEAEKIRFRNQELKATLDAAQASPHVKTPGVLIRSAQICREISGTVGILCKSGKDRTSMGVTLEQSCILSDSDALLDGQESTRVMRKYGVRRMNVYANTGQGYYAFNSFQQQLLPKCYRPPGGTYGGSVAS
jgi:hypothetical protein